MSAMKQFINLVQVLETYRGKDRFIRGATYIAMFMGGNGNTPTQKKWQTVSAEMGACRVILRLFDDLPMLLFNISKGFGFKEHGVLKVLEVLTSMLNQGFYPTEHIAWLQQKKIISGEPGKWLIIGLLIWASSLFLDIVKCVIKLQGLQRSVVKLLKQRQLDRDSSDGSSAQNTKIKENLHKLSVERRDILLQLAQSSCDFINAISWTPFPGFLWSQKLSKRANGVFGLIATGLMLYRNWPKTS